MEATERDEHRDTPACRQAGRKQRATGKNVKYVYGKSKNRSQNRFCILDFFVYDWFLLFTYLKSSSVNLSSSVLSVFVFLLVSFPSFASTSGFSFCIRWTLKFSIFGKFAHKNPHIVEFCPMNHGMQLAFNPLIRRSEEVPGGPRRPSLYHLTRHRKNQ
jgi:hypothetical protein